MHTGKGEQGREIANIAIKGKRHPKVATIPGLIPVLDWGQRYDLWSVGNLVSYLRAVVKVKWELRRQVRSWQEGRSQGVAVTPY